MTQNVPEAPASSFGPGRRSAASDEALRRWTFRIGQWAALAVGLYCGWHGYALVNGNRLALDEAVRWYGASLVFIGLFAWDGALPRPRTWPAGLWDYVRAHPVELVVLALVVAGGAFIRLFRFGTLPPDGFIILEEHIRGAASFDILNGDRPYIYPIPNYMGALGLKIWGPGTDGLRMHDVIAGILTVPVFYLAMREAVSRPAALFAAGVFAGTRVLGDVTVHHQSSMFFQVLMVWLLLRACRTGNLLWFVPATAIAAVLSYEYETAKALPLFAAAFLVFISLRAVLWPIPREFRSVWARVRPLAPFAAKAVIVIGAVILVGLGPMRAESNRGRNIYLGSLDRNQADRGSETLAPDWDVQLKYSVQALTPWVTPDYNDVGSIAAGGFIDKVTSTLLWASVIAGVLLFWRGYRALFIGWLVSGVVIGSLLLSNWAAWKMIGWLPPAIALTGFFADDLLGLARRLGRPAVLGVTAALAGAVVVAFLLNVRTLDRNADNPIVLKEWSNNPSYLFSICDQLNRRPDQTYAIASQRQRGAWGFGGGVITPEDIKKRWGDFRFACIGLEGMPTASLQEVWPFSVVEDRPYTLIQAAAFAEANQIVDTLARAMPQLGAPDERRIAPAESFEVLAYDTTRDEINASQGLVLQWLDAEDRPIGDPEIAVTADGHVPPPGAQRYSLTGLVYAPARVTAALAPVTGGAGVSVEVTRQPTFADGQAIEILVVKGWQLVQIKGPATEPLALKLAWLASDGSVFDVVPAGMFALADMNVWLHWRQLQPADGPEEIVQRYDFQPHVAALDGIRADAATPLAPGTTVEVDYYQGYWDAGAGGPFTFVVGAPNQQVEMKINGTVVIAKNRAAGGEFLATLDLRPGVHLIELTFDAPEAAYIGGLIWTADPITGDRTPLVARPFREDFER